MFFPPNPSCAWTDYIDQGGLVGLAAALEIGPDATISQVEAAGIRGRGGAGFPTGRKWRSLFIGMEPNDIGAVVVNAAEGEPGTMKDRMLLRRNPYAVLEGALIAARSLGVSRIIVATKGKYTEELASVRRAIAELEHADYTLESEIMVVEGPDHYLFGEETALLEVVEGEEPLPRHLPPYLYGLFTTAPQLGWSAGSDAIADDVYAEGSNPSLVNNVETYAHVAFVLAKGVDPYRAMGTVESPGPTIVTLSGDVRTAAVFEIELGRTLRSVIDSEGGGLLPGRTVKGVLSGVSNPALGVDALDTPITYEHLATAGGGLGSAGFIIYDDRRNMVDVAYQVMRFLSVESCGQCNPCKTGTVDLAVVFEQLVQSTIGRDAAMSTIKRRIATVADGSRCFLPTQAQRVVTSILQMFPEDVEARLNGSSGDPSLILPKLVDISNGVAEFDQAQVYKRPDWTYADTPVRIQP